MRKKPNDRKDLAVVFANASSLPEGKKPIKVTTLNGETVVISVDAKHCRVQNVLDCVFEHLQIQDRAIFGLTRVIDDEHRFLEPGVKVAKALPKEWRTCHGSSKKPNNTCTVIAQFYLRVQVFVDEIRLIRDQTSLVHYYWQLRENMRLEWDELSVPEERVFHAVAFALQADHGSYRHDKPADYFDPGDYFPPWVVCSRGEGFLRRHMPLLHAGLDGLSPDAARVQFCLEVSLPPCPANHHVYRGLFRVRPPSSSSSTTPVDSATTANTSFTTSSINSNKNNQDTLTHASVSISSASNSTLAPNECLLCILCRGVEVLAHGRRVVIDLPWSRIGKIAFLKKKFFLASVEGMELSFVTASEDKARHLLFLCRLVHQVTLQMQPALEVIRHQLSHQRQMRKCLLYADSAEDMECLHSSCTPILSGIVGQRVSVVSDASSNTTSGIVSDKPHNADGSDVEESDRENIVDSALSLDFDRHQLESIEPSSLADFGVLRASMPAIGLRKYSVGQNSCSDGGTLGGTIRSSEDAHSVTTTETGRLDDADTSTLGNDDESGSTPTVRSKRGVLRMNINPSFTSQDELLYSGAVSNVIDDFAEAGQKDRKIEDDNDSLQRRPGQSRVRISELREQTLPDYSSSPTTVAKRSHDLPLVSSAYLNNDDSSRSQVNLPDDNSDYSAADGDRSQNSGTSKRMKSLSTQTGGSLGYNSKLNDLKPVSVFQSPPPVITSGLESREGEIPRATNSAGLLSHGLGSHGIPGGNLTSNQSVSACNLNQLPTSVSSHYVPAFVEPPKYHQAIRRESLALPCSHGGAVRTATHSRPRWPSFTGLPETIIAQLARLPELQQANSEPGLSSGYHESLSGVVSVNPSPPAPAPTPPIHPMMMTTGHSYDQIPQTSIAAAPFEAASSLNGMCQRCLSDTQKSRSSNWLNQERAFNQYDDINTLLAACAFRQYLCGHQPQAKPHPCQNGVRRSSPTGGAAHQIARNQSDSPRKQSARIVRTQSNTADHSSARDVNFLENKKRGSSAMERTAKHAMATTHVGHGRQCSCCHEAHPSDAAMDIEQLKDLCRKLPDSLPMVKALAADPYIRGARSTSQQRPASLATSSAGRLDIDNILAASPAHPDSPCQNHHTPVFRTSSGRPVSWHEAYAQLAGVLDPAVLSATQQQRPPAVPSASPPLRLDLSDMDLPPPPPYKVPSKPHQQALNVS